MRTNIIIQFEIEALHNWPEARQVIPEMGFLSDIHMHYFSFKISKEVKHDEREVEIIQFRRKVIDYYYQTFFDSSLGTHNFGSRSCETLARNLMEQFDCQSVEVLEDNKNGAEIWK